MTQRSEGSLRSRFSFLQTLALQGVLTLFTIMVFSLVTGLLPASAGEAGSGKSCDPFIKSFAKDTTFTIKDWPGRSNGEMLLSPRLKHNVSVTLVDQSITIPDPDEDPVKAIHLSAAKGNIKLDGKTALEQPLSYKRSELTSAQLQRLFAGIDQEAGFPIWVIVEDEGENLFRLHLKGQKQIRKMLFEQGLEKLEFAEGAVLKFSKLDKDKMQAEIFQDKPAESAPLTFKDFFNTELKLPFSMALAMVPPQLAESRSLSVIRSLRAVERSTLNLTMEQGKTPFGDLVFRGCMAKIVLNSAGKAEPDDVLDWVPIDSITVTSAKTGSAEIAAVIPSLPDQQDDTWFNSTFGHPLATLGHIFSDNQDNTRIRIMAADANGLRYSGVTEHFVDSRSLAVVIGILAFAIAYCLPIWLWRPGGNVKDSAIAFPNMRYSLLSLVRGRDGTASLSNLQIWWWTLAVFALVVFVWVATGGLASFNQSVVILLGVTTGGSLAAKAVAINMKGATQNIVAIQGQTEQVEANWWDLIAAGEQVSLTKLQMLVFTIFTGLYVVSTVIGQLKFPEIPTELLTLMGVSNGIYVLGKATSSNLYVQLAGLQVRLQGIDEQIASNAGKKDELEKQMVELKGKLADDCFDEETQKKLKPLNTKLKKAEADIVKLLDGKSETELNEAGKKKLQELKNGKLEIEKSIREEKGKATTSGIDAEHSKAYEALEAQLKPLRAMLETKKELEKKIEELKASIKKQEAAASGVA